MAPDEDATKCQMVVNSVVDPCVSRSTIITTIDMFFYLLQLFTQQNIVKM